MRPQRLDVSYSIDWKGHWHVGSGFRTAATDRMIQRLKGHRGSPFVPGSQIKGVLRHTCERLANTLGLDTVDPHATGTEQEQLLVHNFRPLHESNLIVDRLFGSRYQGECLFVSNAIDEVAEDRAVETRTASSTRARTALDRVTGTVREGHLFTTEIADGNRSLQGTIRARHPTGVLTQDNDRFPFEYALLIAGLLLVDGLGGDKSIGLGQCGVSIGQVAWNSRQMSVEDCLESFNEEEWSGLVMMAREEQ